MIYQVSLNSTVLTDLPQGLENLQLTAELDAEIHGLFYKYSTNLTFIGDGYTTLKTLADSAYCSLVNVLIEWKCEGDKDFTTLFKGNIVLTKVEFNLSDCYATAAVIDDTIGARIVNNFNTRAILGTDRSIVGDSITAAASTALDFFTPSTGVFNYLNRVAFSVYEAFQFLVKYCTNGQCDFASTTFGTGGTWEHLYLLTGKSVRQSTVSAPPEVSMSDLVLEINKRIPIGLWLEDNAGTPRIRVEERSYFYGSSTNMTCRNIGGDEGLVRTIDENQLYSVIKFGQSEVTLKQGTYNYPDQRWVGWTKEEYNFSSLCSQDNILDLSSDWMMDSNTIEKLLTVPTTLDFDDRVFLVEGRFNNPNYEAIPYSDAVTTYYYNREMTNYSTAIRWSPYIPAPFSKWLQLSTVDNLCLINLGSDDGPYTATTSLQTINADPYPFDNEVYDRGNNFDGATNYRYTFPDSGVYIMEVGLAVALTLPSLANMSITIDVRRYNAANALQETQSDTAVIGTQNFNYAFRVIMAATSTDYVNVKLSSQTTSGSVEYTMDSTTRFQMFTAPDTVIDFPQPEVPKLTTYRFNYPLSKSQWETIISNLNDKIIINPGSDTANDVDGYIRQITYRVSEGVADFDLIA